MFIGLLIHVNFSGEKRQKLIDEMLDDKPKPIQPPSPKIDPRSGRPYDPNLAAALRIDHDPPPPNIPVDWPMGDAIPGNPPNAFLPPNIDQTPSEYSFTTNHSDQGYLSTPSFHGDNFNRNQFGGNASGQFGHSIQGGSNFTGHNPPLPPQSPFVNNRLGSTPSSSSGFGGTPMSFDSSVPKTPATPQTPAPPLMNDIKNNHYGNRDRGSHYNKHRDRRDRRDSYNNRDRDNNDNSYNRDRNRNSDWHRDSNRDRDRDSWNKDRYGRERDSYNRRDWRNERDNRDRNRYRDRDRNNRNDYIKDNREEEKPRNKIPEKEIIPPSIPLTPIVPPPQEEIYTPAPPVFVPKPPVKEVKEEEEPRSMSLDSRIQSLLSGFKSPEPAQPKEEVPHVHTKASSQPAIAQDNFNHDRSSPYDTISRDQEPVAPPYEYHTGNSSGTEFDGGQPWIGQKFPNGALQSVPSQDDDDRMSLDSNESAHDQSAIEIHPTDSTVPQPLIPTEFQNSGAPTSNWQQQSQLANSFMTGFMNTYNNRQFNQNFMNNFNDSVTSGELSQSEKEKEEELDNHEVTFNNVLENFVKELKEVMVKDLCKKMVESSAYKTYERWWDREEQKTKVFPVSLTLYQF